MKDMEGMVHSTKKCNMHISHCKPNFRSSLFTLFQNLLQ